ncbi:MAG: Uma2 family endonuclease [Oscillatoriaceae bacterium SKW80]|nr:Uma2 family endonuclease [Oscillatoriaceae bacterium SKYG93]MCX8119342.1 Uma2 family endonuclease [Oscillatoriaceae bacterium SKW80]MDW8454809.1 Uma2 family endonuclease [Oscillatoriaceae cyanobacterium SKYGB_i_bin93]HIK28410.1 Uma2 family endonuclease [Oscillatoriaceae cyanobacterium M7585_C2015_266]
MPNLTFDEYLQQEKYSLARCEYISGYLFELSELSERHNLILNHISCCFLSSKNKNNLRLFIGDMKLWIESAEVCYYPDLMVVDESKESNKNFKTSPCLLIEVVAANTEGTERCEKWKVYKQLPSLEEYVLIDENKVNVEVFRKDYKGNWGVEKLREDDKLLLNSVGLCIEVSEIYAYVFAPEE